MNRFSRPKDKAYEEAMHCEKSHDDRHHFIPRRERETQHLECAHCGTAFNADLHSPPDGYEPVG